MFHNSDKTNPEVNPPPTTAKKNKVEQGRRKGQASDTALSAIATAGAMIHGRIHQGIGWRAINHPDWPHHSPPCSPSEREPKFMSGGGRAQKGPRSYVHLRACTCARVHPENNPFHHYVNLYNRISSVDVTKA